MTDELLTRGVEKIYPSQEKLTEALAAGRKLKIYFGIDPTGPSLHLGHATNLLKLREFQDQGHDIILLIGDFTAMIGDPTDKTAARVKLSADEVRLNMRSYLEQAGRILDLDKTTIRYNSEWLAKLNLGDLLELFSHLTIAQMIKRDMFQKRLAEGKDLFLHEFLYPLMQGYDSVALGVDMEVGGNDQLFNMLVGRDLLKSLKGEEKFVLTTKLLVDPSGKKMGKTEGNMVSLADDPSDAYGKVMSWPDSLMPLGFEICTRRDLSEVAAMIEADPFAAKKALARDIVSTFFGDAEAARASENFAAAFQKEEVPADALELSVARGTKLGDLLLEAGLVKSKTEFRRLVEGGAIKDLASGEAITDPEFKITKAGACRVGKHRFVKFVLA